MRNNYCLIENIGANSLEIRYRYDNQTDQQLAGNFADIVFEGTLSQCKKEKRRMERECIYAVYASQEGDRYIVPIHIGDGTFQENMSSSYDDLLETFTSFIEAESYINSL